MLLTRLKSLAPSPHDLSNVHNYYERMVTATLLETSARAREDLDFHADTSCVALNHLPPRYIRHDVDMTFFLSPVEYEEMQQKVKHAVDYAIQFVTERERERQQQQEFSETKPQPLNEPQEQPASASESH